MAHARQWAHNGDSTTSRRRIDTPRNAPSDAAAERALLFTPAVPRRLLGPHAWSRARVDRLAPRKEPKPSGEGSPSPLHCAPASPFPTPKSWDVGVRGVLWPHAGFCAYNFSRGRERAPSIHATAPHDPLCRAPKLVGLLWGSLVQAKGCREAPGVAISGCPTLASYAARPRRRACAHNSCSRAGCAH